MLKTVPHTIADQRKKSDARTIVNRHLADPNHVITEEEMRNIRIGVTTIVDPHTTGLLRGQPQRRQA